MLTALATSALVFHGPHGFWFLGPIFGLLWFGLILALVIVLARRGRRGWGYGPGYAHGGPWASAQAARNAETVLAERYAQGDIDEKEYRARLEVLRASAPQPPQR
ncbi:MAG: hypothetical protein J0G30_08695 [Actinomycetales bacterium]|nr:hypothetical protein [Actinomycetales bacterium]